MPEPGTRRPWLLLPDAASLERTEQICDSFSAMTVARDSSCSHGKPAEWLIRSSAGPRVLRDAGASHHGADGGRLLRPPLLAGQGLEILQVPPGVLLVLPHVVDQVGDHHGEPAEHGDQHGDVRGLFVHVAEVRVGDHLQESFADVLLLRGGVAHDAARGAGHQVHRADQLLQPTVTQPGVVGEVDLGLQVAKGVFAD